MRSIGNVRWLWFIKNVCCFFRSDIYKELSELKLQQKKTQERLKNLWQEEISFKNRELLFEIMMYYDVHRNEADKYADELKFIEQNGLEFFPYEKTKQIKMIESGYDTILKMPWVLHKDKKLYFPSSYTIEQAKSTYANFIENENILDAGYRVKSPHQYQSDTFKIEDGDVVVDVGCAEGLVSLDVIEKVKKVYLIESDIKWVDALNATFAPYKDKVVLINKLVSDCDSESSITLSTLFNNEKNSPLFVKMDVEGYETTVIASSKDFLCNQDNVKLACCTYHKKNDETILKCLLESYGYEINFSDGYMLYWLDENITPPYFRRGVIRASKRHK